MAISLVLAATLVASSPRSITAKPIAVEAAPQFKVSPVATGFNQPVFVTNAGDARLFVMERSGKIWGVENGAVLATPFLDLGGLVTNGGDEQSMLGLAFEPNYQSTGRFYVSYTSTDNGAIHVARYTVSGNPNVADPASGVTVLSIPHPDQTDHNSGWMGFGPDGLLYLTIGDGGGDIPDQYCTSTNIAELRGKLLRINVVGQITYTSPLSNAFGAGQAPQVFALGLRNAWRASIDPVTGDVYIGDVGQGLFEEIDVLRPSDGAGVDFGWSTREALHAFSNPANCPTSGRPLKDPVIEYAHNGSRAVVGGYVYRGQDYPWLNGKYIYGDYVTGQIWSAVPVSPTVFTPTLIVSLTGGQKISSFGEDQNHEIYVAAINSGTIYRLVSLIPRASLPSIVLP